MTPELREQAEALQREALNIFQAFLTAYSERTGGAGRAGAPGGPADGRPGNSPPDDRGPAADPGSGREVTDIPLD